MGEHKILDEVGEMEGDQILDEVGERGEVDIVKHKIRERPTKSAKGVWRNPTGEGCLTVNGQSRRIHAEFSPSQGANVLKPCPPYCPL